MTKQMTYIVLHHTAVSRDKQKNQLQPVNTYHRDKNWGTTANPWYQPNPSSLGWYVGYNYFCDVNGKRTNTREIGTETIAQTGHNCDVPKRCDSVSYCMAGNFNNELPNESQLKDFRKFVSEMEELYPNIRVVFHSDLQKNRTCPGKLITKEYLKSVMLKKVIYASDDVDKEKEEEILKLKKKIITLEYLVKTLINMLMKLRKK